MKPAVAKVTARAGWARPPIAILGVPFDNLTIGDALERVEAMIASRQPHYLVTPNVDFLVQARQDIELRRILFEAHLVLCDGTPLVWASRLLGNPLPERVAGADVVPLLIGMAEERGHRLFLLGATPESSRQAVDRLREKHPKLVICGNYSPPFNKLLDMDHEEIKGRILQARPDLLLVSLGCPKQEKWIAMHYRTLGVPVTIGVGATIDFLAGQVRRAPVWMQHTGTEWIFRLAQEPRRLFRRYWTDLWSFGGSLCLQWWQLKGHSGRDGHGGSASGPEVGRQCGLFPSADIGVRSQRVCLPERFDVAAVCDYGRQVEQQLAADCHCLLDMSGVSFIDSTGVGFLIRLQKRIRADGWQLILLNPGTEVRRALSVLGLENFFLSADDLATARELIEAQQYSPYVALARAGVENTVTWRGEITAANTEHIWSETANLLAAASGASWSIDMAQVSFIDSSGLGLMIRVKKFANYVVMFKNVHPAVRNVVRIAGLEQFLLEAPGQGDGLNRQNARQTSRQLTSDGTRSEPKTSTAKL